MEFNWKDIDDPKEFVNYRPVPWASGGCGLKIWNELQKYCSEKGFEFFTLRCSGLYCKNSDWNDLSDECNNYFNDMKPAWE